MKQTNIHVFLLPSKSHLLLVLAVLTTDNEIVTVVNFYPDCSEVPSKLHEPKCAPPQGRVNAVAVLWRIIALRKSLVLRLDEND
jgi:hypothetical protein